MAEKKAEVVVITGASAGVGRAVVREFAKRQANIGLIARGQERLEAARQEVEEQGGKALVLPTDVADADGVMKAAQQVTDTFGPLDVWVNDAMTTIFAPFSDIRPDEFKRATEVTYLGCVYGTMAALKHMKERDRGTIVQVGSALAYRSIPLQSPYCGAKHGIVGFTDSVRCELIHQRSKIHITVVDLPAMNTPQFNWCRTRLPNHPQPVPPIFEPEVAAKAIYWAAHHRRREVFVGGPTVKAIYGQDLAPGFADWYLGKNGYSAQQTDEPVSPDRPDNLFEPVPGDYAAHGIFADRSKNFSLQTWMTLHRATTAIAAAGLASVGALIWRKVV
ncbi:MAG: SDR family oxidoreductase [Acidobacteriaceae bacterium]|nr:SDR family oxidoreductase [Acidobacteriaceae bacterium]MBV8571335.1 SDR family oxidoreductase [Acidobacteriaceae bacterium]